MILVLNKFSCKNNNKKVCAVGKSGRNHLICLLLCLYDRLFQEAVNFYYCTVKKKKNYFYFPEQTSSQIIEIRLLRLRANSKKNYIFHAGLLRECTESCPHKSEIIIIQVSHSDISYVQEEIESATITILGKKTPKTL